MKGRLAVIMLLAMLAVLPLAAPGSDAASGLIGEGSSDTMSVTYYEDLSGFAAITLAESPSVKDVGILVVDSDLNVKARIGQMPAAKVMGIDLPRLDAGTYTFMVMKADGSTFAPPIECDVVVHEQSAGTHIVTFDPNGGSGAMSPVIVTSGTLDLPGCGFTAPSGQSFKEWSVDGVAYQPGASVTVSKDMAVKAVWAETGDSGSLLLYIGIGAAVVVALLVVLLLLRRKG